MRFRLSLVFLVGFLSVNASDSYLKNEAIDVIHYRFQLALNDSTNHLAGQASITILFRKAISEFELDLVNQNSVGEGMRIDQITLHGSAVHFTHERDRIKITLPAPSVPGQSIQILIAYGGVPQDGLIISKNKFGDRTFFGDNWPDRAHHWLPSIDHPSEKATCEFIVLAPAYYTVIGNGKKVEESIVEKNQKLTHWKETVEIPMKVMVIGVARFAIKVVGHVDHIPVETWVYPQNRDAGFLDYAVALKILDFFQRRIGPYPYEKLANVQSKTRYGGMENASNIFYSENSVDGKNNHESLIAHEIAHQWFGNSATERDWHHVWLSEGFATYFSDLYAEAVSGRDAFADEMSLSRQQVVSYSKINNAPVIDTTTTDLMKLLNTNSYQKGSWILHMLRHEVGDLQFWDGIQLYYQRYQNSSAMTADFQQVMEDVSKKDLKLFFDQWLWSRGYPKIAGIWKFNSADKSVTVSISQIQSTSPFNFPLDLAIVLGDGSREVRTFQIDRKSQEFTFPETNRPRELILDPKTWLLFEGEIREK